MAETTEKKKPTPEEMRAQELERWAKQCTSIMAVSKKTECPPEAVAQVVLMNGLNAQIHFEGELLRLTLVKIFGQQRNVVIPESGHLVH